MRTTVRLTLVCGAVAVAAVGALHPATAKNDREVVRVSGTNLLPPGCAHDDAQPESELEPRVAANPANGENLVAVWQQDRHRAAGGARGTGVATSSDGGRSWTPAAMPGFGCLSDVDAKGSDPWVSFGPDRVYVSALVGQDDHFGARVSDDPNAVVVATSIDGGRRWSPPVRVANGASFDKPTVTADPYRPGTAYVTWSQFSWYTCAAVCNVTTATMFARTDDGGATWSPPQVVAPSLVPFEQMGNPEVSVLPDGTLVAMHGTFEYHYDVPGNVAPCLVPPYDVCGRMHIRSQTSTDGGRSWSAPVSVAMGRLPELVTDPEAQPDGTRARVRASWGWYPFTQVAGRNGKVYAAWINRHFASPPSDSRKAEIQLAESADGGRSWQVRTVMSFDHEVFIPTIDVDDRGTLALTWYGVGSDRADDTEWSADVWFASSRDGGSTWRLRRLAGPFDLRQAPLAGNIGTDLYFVGDYEGLTHTGDHFVAVFMQPVPAATRQSDIVAVRVPAR